MSLQPNTTLHCLLKGSPLTVVKKLGEGGQGEVYLVKDSAGKQSALKWYFPEQATEKQKNAIKLLVQKGAPTNPPAASQRFIWPQDIVEDPNNSQQFGYQMALIDTDRFASLGEIQSGRKPQPSLAAMCEISYQLVESYRSLHLSGYCYRDISKGNMMFDPQTGNVLICDNDNVGIEGQSDSQVLGTLEFMAPEIIQGQAQPSTKTDLHSLAVLLFDFWMWHHPMHGDLECAIRSWDLPAKKKIYGQEPVFIFDPNNTKNRPNDPDYGTVRRRWEIAPEPLKQLFIKAFGVGLQDPNQRVTEAEWQLCFLQLKELILTCPSCRAENFYDPSQPSLSCWHCKKAIPVPSQMELKTPSGSFYVLLTEKLELKQYHLTPASGRDGKESVIGRLVQNPNNPNQWGLRNLTNSSWQLTLADGTTKEVPPQKASPLAKGAKLEFLPINTIGIFN